MGSVCGTIEETIDYLNARGGKYGLVKVRLYRPFRADKLIDAIPIRQEHSCWIAPRSPALWANLCIWTCAGS